MTEAQGRAEMSRLSTADQGQDSMSLDPLFMAYSLYRRKRYEESAKICTEILQKNPYDQVSYQDNHFPRTHDISFCRRLGS